MSTARGRQAFEALKSVRAFYAEVSRLIGTADNWLGAEVGWKANYNNLLRNTSGQLRFPSKWQPEAVDRWYITSDPHIAAYLCVILLPYNTDSPVEEPLVSTGWVRSSRKVQYNDPPRWVSYTAMWTEDSRDGAFHTVSLGTVPDAQGRELHRFSAQPLFDLHNSEDLVERVLRPLIAEVPNAKPSASMSGSDSSDGIDTDEG